MAMQQALLAAFAAVCLLSLTVASEDPTGSLPGVIDLTPENFDKYVNGGKDALVEFYAPWCGHCKHLTPEYKKLGEAVAANGALKNRVVIAKVDADAHRSLGERFGVQGFPTLKYFHRGKPTTEPSDYSGGRNLDGFLKYIDDALAADKGFARIPALDTLAATFSSAPDPKKVLSDLTAQAGKLTDEAQKTAGAIYVKYVQKAVEKGSDFFDSEKARLERLLQSGNVGTAKLGEISQKLSVLSAFEKKDADEE